MPYNIHSKTRAKLDREFTRILTESHKELSAREVGQKYAMVYQRPIMSGRRAGIHLRRMWLRDLVWRRLCTAYSQRLVFLYRLKGRVAKK